MPDDVRELSPREGYDRWAAGYDGYDNPLITLEQPVVRALLGDVAGLRIADIGCGTGRLATWLLDRGANVTGVDFSSGMLDVLRRKPGAEALTVIEHDLTRGIPLDSERFDLVTCCLVIEHLPDLAGIVGELARICRPRGRVVITDLHPEMVRRGHHARFRETPGAEKWQIRGAYHTISDYVITAQRSGLRIEHLSEHEMTVESARGSRSAQKWLGDPFLFVLSATLSCSCSRRPFPVRALGDQDLISLRNPEPRRVPLRRGLACATTFGTQRLFEPPRRSPSLVR